MKTTLNYIRKSDGRVFEKTFKSKKDANRFQSNNYTEYKFVN